MEPFPVTSRPACGMGIGNNFGFLIKEFELILSFPSLFSSQKINGPFIPPAKHPQTITDFRPLLKIGVKHSVLNLSPVCLQTLICRDCLPISTLDSSEKITCAQS